MSVSLSPGPGGGVGGSSQPIDLCAQRPLQPEPAEPYISHEITIHPGYFCNELLYARHPSMAVLVKSSTTVAHEGPDHIDMAGQFFEKDSVLCTRHQLFYH
jgi:hypothetical protein